MKRLYAALLASVLSLMLGACGATEESAGSPDAAVAPQDAGTVAETDAGPQGTPPTVSVLAPAAYAGAVAQIDVQVQASDDEGIAKVELFVGDGATPVRAKLAEPWTLTLDATNLTLGETTFYVRATDTSGLTADSARIPIILAGGGKELLFTRTISVPADYDGTLDLDSKSHWYNAGETHIAAVVEWELADGQAAWDPEMAIGWGECPHSGGALATANVVTGSPIVASAEDARSYGTTMRFVHVAPLDALQHKGEQLTYVARVYVW